MPIVEGEALVKIMGLIPEKARISYWC